METTNQIKGFPQEIIDKMIERQVEQGNKRSVSVFKRNKRAGEAEKTTSTLSWQYAKDIDTKKESIPEYTMDQLFEKLGEKFIIKNRSLLKHNRLSPPC